MTDKLAQKYIYIHYTQQTRAKFRWAYIGIITLLLLLFIGAATMLYYSINWGVTSSSDYDPKYPDASISNTILFYFGIAFFVIVFFVSIYFAFLIPVIYKKSRMLYFKTDKYKKLVLKYEDRDLSRYSKKKLKWLYKLGYISKVDKVSALTAKKKKR